MSLKFIVATVFPQEILSPQEIFMHALSISHKQLLMRFTSEHGAE